MFAVEALITRHPFFHDLQPGYVHELAGCASYVHFDAQVTIFREGEPANRFYIIDNGLVALQVGVPSRGLVPIQTLRTGDVLGWSWLFAPYRWHFDAVAIEPTEALAFDGACLRGQCEVNHELGYQLMERFARIVVDRLQATRLQMLDLYAAPTPTIATSARAGGHASPGGAS